MTCAYIDFFLKVGTWVNATSVNAASKNARPVRSWTRVTCSGWTMPFCPQPGYYLSMQARSVSLLFSSLSRNFRFRIQVILPTCRSMVCSILVPFLCGDTPCLDCELKWCQKESNVYQIILFMEQWKAIANSSKKRQKMELSWATSLKKTCFLHLYNRD